MEKSGHSAPYFAAVDETIGYGSKSIGLIKSMDSTLLHYSVILICFVDFIVNATAIAFLSADYTYVEWAAKLRLLSMGCAGAAALDLILRIVFLRTAICRSKAYICDIFVFLCLGGALAMRTLYADDVDKKIVTIVKYFDEDEPLAENETVHKFPKYRSNQIEIYLAAFYCILVAIRIVLKPHVRVFSSTLEPSQLSSMDTLLISMASLRAALRRIPNITEASIEMMERDLVIICGRQEGDMTHIELMQFLEKAVTRRPPHIGASEFLSHLKDLDAQSTLRVYGALDVVKSTLRHWSNQRTALACTIFVVLVHAAITPLLAYFMGLLGDKAFPNSVSKVLRKDNRGNGERYGYVDTQIVPKNKWVYHDEEGFFTYFNPDQVIIVGVVGILLLCIPFAVADFFMGYFQTKMIAKATERIQGSLLKTILAQPTPFFSQRTEGDLNNLFQSDIARVNALWQAVFWNLMHPIVSVVAGFAFLIYFEPSVGMVSLGLAAILISTGPQGHASQKSKEFGSKNAFVAAEFQNAVACQNVVRAYDIQSPLLAKFTKSTMMLSKSQFMKDFWSGVVQIYIDSAMYIFVSIMTTGMAVKVYNADMTAGDFFSAVTLLARISTPVTVLGGFMRVAIGNASSLQRLDEILHDTHSEDDEDKNLPAVPRMKQILRVDRLTFQYDITTDVWNLQDVTASFAAGQYVCIVGPSGCGKSTLLGCLMQFYEPTDGVIAVDSHNLLQYSRSSYLAQTAVVFQDGGILNGSILENIRFGNANATDAECKEAAEMAECGSFISALKDGYDTIVGQHATVNLSGGQSQRICLARALVRKPTILLLDEATSALDAETEASIVEMLTRLAKQLNMAVISVTHRLSTTRSADSILVMENGRIVDRGTFHELLSHPTGPFAELMQKTTVAQDRQHRVSETLSRASITNTNQLAEDLDAVNNSQRALQMFAEELRNRADSRENQRSRKNSSFMSNSSVDSTNKAAKKTESDEYVVL